MSGETRKKTEPGQPPRERWGEVVPKGGTSCANCTFLKDKEKMLCGNPDFIIWEGPNKPANSGKIPAKTPDMYCSIWWAPIKSRKSGLKAAFAKE